MNRLWPVVFAASAVLIVVVAVTAAAIEHRYSEDFTSRQYCDTIATTAWWDTTSGELKLYPFEINLIGHYATTGLSFKVAVAGDYAYVANYYDVVVLDISDPANPYLAGSYNTPGNAWDVVLSGDYLYVADYSSGLQILSIVDPTNPVLVGAYDTPNLSMGLFVYGDYAYVADYDSLLVIDVSDPAVPTRIGGVDTPGWVFHVVACGDVAYVADEWAGLKLFDISDPANPSLIGSYDTFGNAIRVAVAGDYAYVADYGEGLHVVDVSDPTNPTYAGRYNTPGSSYDVKIAGDYAYVADYGSGLLVFDIRNPAHPLLRDSYDTPGNARGVAVSGNHAFVADHAGGLQVIEIACPTPPVQVGSYDTPDAYYRVAVDGDHAFIADGASGLQVIDISDPTNPTLAGSYDTPGTAYDVAVARNLAFVADRYSGLQVIDISDPTIPILAGSYDTPGAAYGIAVSGDHAFIADGVSGLQVIDISDPASPTLAGSCDTPDQAWHVAVAGDHAFVADRTSGLQVIDISDPANPTLAGSCDTPGAAFGIVVSGDYAFVADWSAGLQVIDISDPANPTLAGSYDTPGNPYNVAVSGDRAFVADHTYGLLVIDISDPTTPVLEGSSEVPRYAFDVAVSGDHAFVGDNGSGLKVFLVYQHEFDANNDTGQSLVVNASSDAIRRVCFATTQTNGVTWELSADGGLNWQGVTPGGSWSEVNVPGADLLWRSTHTWTAPGVNPGVTELEIEWLCECPAIDSIVDVSGDQGGWARVHFTRSGYDFVDETTYPVTEYYVFGRVDNPAMAEAVLANGRIGRWDAGHEEIKLSPPVAVDGGRPTSVRYNGRTFVDGGSPASGGPPPGLWEVLGGVTAEQLEHYTVEVPTLCDSASSFKYTVYCLSAETSTPSVYYYSPPDSGYSVDNVAPTAPQGFTLVYNTVGGNVLTWEPCPDSDFHYYNIYRSETEAFTPGPTNLVHATIDTTWTDPVAQGWRYYYKTTALDYVGNESEASSPTAVTGAGPGDMPETTFLYPNVPNPFNPSTEIRFDIPRRMNVKLEIFNVHGQRIRVLENGEQDPGRKSYYWRGLNERGAVVASGVYFYRLETPDYSQTRKMILLR